jgi:hypothetical protein
MTDERLNQILKESLAPEIDGDEIKVRMAGRKRRHMVRRFAVCGLAACAIVFGIFTGLHFEITPQYENSEDIAANAESIGAYAEDPDTNAESGTKHRNMFAITAYASELPEDIVSGEFTGLGFAESDWGSSRFMSERFAVSGHNIEKVRVSTDTCELYTVVPVHIGDPEYEEAMSAGPTEMEEYCPIAAYTPEGERYTEYEHVKVVGSSYEGTYNEQMQFGMSVPEELWSTNEDPKESAHEDIDRLDGAVLTVEITFADGSKEEHHYRLNTGKIYVPIDEEGRCLWDQLTRFLTEEESLGQTPYAYGYLMEIVD